MMYNTYQVNMKLSAQKIYFPPKTVKILLNLVKWNDKALIQRRIFRPWPLFIYMCPIYLCSPGSQLSIATSHVGLNILPTVVKSHFLNWIPSSWNLRKMTYFLFWTFYDTYYIKQNILKKFHHNHKVKTVLEVPESYM